MSVSMARLYTVTTHTTYFDQYGDAEAAIIVAVATSVATRRNLYFKPKVTFSRYE